MMLGRSSRFLFLIPNSPLPSSIVSDTVLEMGDILICVLCRERMTQNCFDTRRVERGFWKV